MEGSWLIFINSRLDPYADLPRGYLITLSARISTNGGIVRPNTLALRALTTSLKAAGPRRCATTPGATQGLQESPPILVCGAAFRLPIVGKISPASHPGFCIHSLLRDSCCCLVPFAFSSPNDFVRSCQHVRWNRQAKCLRGLQIDHELELRRLLHWQLGRLGTFKNFVDVVCGALEILRFVG